VGEDGTWHRALHEVAYFNYSEVGGPGTLFGVKATRDVVRGDVVAKIPYTSLFTWGHSVEDDPVLRSALGSGSRASENAMDWFSNDGHVDTDDFDAWMLPLVGHRHGEFPGLHG